MKFRQRKICATAWCALNADAQIKAEHCSYQHYSKALRHDICQEACCKVWSHHQEHIQVKYCCPHTLWGSTLSQLLFNQEVMFVTAPGKLMAPFPHRREEKKKTWEVQHTTHTHAFGCGGEEGKVGSGLLDFSFSTLQLHQCVIDSRDTSDTMLQKSRIKVDDISQQSL